MAHNSTPRYYWWCLYNHNVDIPTFMVASGRMDHELLSVKYDNRAERMGGGLERMKVEGCLESFN